MMGQRCSSGLLLVSAMMLSVCALPAAAQIQINSTNPSSAAQGTISLDVIINGNGFKKGAKAQWFVTGTTNPGGVAVNSTAFNDSGQLTANITIASGATISGYDVAVTNTDGRTGKGTDVFAVIQAPQHCSGVPLQLIVMPQAPGQGGVSGDGMSIYNNPSDPFNGGTLYQDGVGGVFVEFLICNGSNDLVVNLIGTSRYLNLDFSVQLAQPDTADGALDLTGTQLHQQGQQINEMANRALYTNGQFVDCSGFQLNGFSKTVIGGNVWFHPSTLYDPIVPDCNGGAPQNLANTPINTSSVLIQQVNACTWTVSPNLDSTGAWYRAGVAETVKKGTSSSVEGGQYQMPFSYEIQELNCTP